MSFEINLVTVPEPDLSVEMWCGGGGVVVKEAERGGVKPGRDSERLGTISVHYGIKQD